MENKHCLCGMMKQNGWAIERKNDGRYNLNEEYSCHRIENVVVCPWCGCDLNDVPVQINDN